MGAHFMILYNSSRPEAQTPPVAAAPRPSLDDPIRDPSPPPRAGGPGTETGSSRLEMEEEGYGVLT